MPKIAFRKELVVRAAPMAVFHYRHNLRDDSLLILNITSGDVVGMPTSKTFAIGNARFRMSDGGSVRRAQGGTVASVALPLGDPLVAEAREAYLREKAEGARRAEIACDFTKACEEGVRVSTAVSELVAVTLSHSGMWEGYSRPTPEVGYRRSSHIVWPARYMALVDAAESLIEDDAERLRCVEAAMSPSADMPANLTRAVNVVTYARIEAGPLFSDDVMRLVKIIAGKDK